MVLQHCIACSGVAMPRQSTPYAARATVSADERSNLLRGIMTRTDEPRVYRFGSRVLLRFALHNAFQGYSCHACYATSSRTCPPPVFWALWQSSLATSCFATAIVVPGEDKARTPNSLARTHRGVPSCLAAHFRLLSKDIAYLSFAR